MWVPCSFRDIKSQGIYIITILYLSFHNFKKYSWSVSVWVYIWRWGWLDCCFNGMCHYGTVFKRAVHVYICAHSTDLSGEKLFPGYSENKRFMCWIFVAVKFWMSGAWGLKSELSFLKAHKGVPKAVLRGTPCMHLAVEQSAIRSILRVTGGSLRHAVKCRAFRGPRSPSLSLCDSHLQEIRASPWVLEVKKVINIKFQMQHC